MITQDKLKWLFDYDTVYGGLIKMVRKSGNKTTVKTPNSNGYYIIMIEGKRYFEHRLVWLYHYGEFPPNNLVIDHIDRNRMNNKIENLRLLSRYENMTRHKNILS